MSQESPVDTQDTTTTPAVETPDVNTDGSSNTPAVDEPKSVTIEKHREEITKRNNEASSLRQRLKNAEGELTLTKEQLQNHQNTVADLQAQVQSLVMEREVVIAARDSKLGCLCPEKIHKLMNRDALTFEDGQVKGIDKELKRVKADFPELFTANPYGNADAAAGANNNGFQTGDLNGLIRQMAGR